MHCEGFQTCMSAVAMSQSLLFARIPAVWVLPVSQGAYTVVCKTN